MLLLCHPSSDPLLPKKKKKSLHSKKKKAKTFQQNIFLATLASCTAEGVRSLQSKPGERHRGGRHPDGSKNMGERDSVAPHCCPIPWQGGVPQHRSSGDGLCCRTGCWPLGKSPGNHQPAGGLRGKTPRGPAAPGMLLGRDAGERSLPPGSGMFALATPKRRMGGRDEGEARVGVPGAGPWGALGRAGHPHASSQPQKPNPHSPSPGSGLLTPSQPLGASLSLPGNI